MDADVICKCPCHRKHMMMLHMFPCCKLSYKKYLNDDGSFDQVAYDALTREKENEHLSGL